MKFATHSETSLYRSEAAPQSRSSRHYICTYHMSTLPVEPLFERGSHPGTCSTSLTRRRWSKEQASRWDHPSSSGMPSTRRRSGTDSSYRRLAHPQCMSQQSASPHCRMMFQRVCTRCSTWADMLIRSPRNSGSCRRRRSRGLLQNRMLLTGRSQIPTQLNRHGTRTSPFSALNLETPVARGFFAAVLKIALMTLRVA